MNIFLEILRAFLFGMLEGITEWLPVSSTGHLILLHEFVSLSSNDAFNEMFDVVIQLGAILAVVVLFFDKLYPFIKSKNIPERRETFSLWGRILIAVIPSAIIGFLFDDHLETYLYNGFVVSLALIFYGVIFIIIERKRQNTNNNKVKDTISTKEALIMGVFQVLSLVPGTSRSGATMIGGLAAGLSRESAADFSFCMAVPTMLGASGLKLIKFFAEGNWLSPGEAIILIVGFLTAFVVSIVSIRFLIGYVKKHTFSVFGAYRIILGLILIIYFFGIRPNL